MAYVESHQSLGRHKKTLRAVAILKCNRHQLIGHLHVLWWWAIDNLPPDGDLGDLSDEEIAASAEWEQDPAEFVGALRRAGFIDQQGERRWMHDWFDYAGKYTERKRVDAERKRGVRRTSGGHPSEVAETSHLTRVKGEEDREDRQTEQAKQPRAHEETAAPRLEHSLDETPDQEEAWLIEDARLKAVQAGFTIDEFDLALREIKRRRRVENKIITRPWPYMKGILNDNRRETKAGGATPSKRKDPTTDFLARKRAALEAGQSERPQK